MQKLYFLALVPPDDLSIEITKLKQYFFDKYQSKASLRSPPHITLHMPFKWDEAKEQHIIEFLDKFSKERHSFNLTLENYGAFIPRVIFIGVNNSQNLNDLQKDLTSFMKFNFNIFNSNYKEQAFHPHITLAFRDLKKRFFFEAWEEFKDKEFAAEFTVQSFSILKHNGKEWEILKSFEF